MKFLCIPLLLSTLFLSQAFAETSAHQNISIIQSIDDQDLPPSYGEASEEVLPLKNFLQLLKRLETNDFTVIPINRVRDLFGQLENNPRARNRIAGGKCSVRRSYIQSYLRKLSISSGRLFLQCPNNSGHMRLIDQSTGHRYTFSNFHDVNLVAVPNDYYVMDVQFENRPMSLSEYLAQVEASQKLKPLKNRAAGDRGFCYWSIR
jgi:hypothetical protein